MGRLYDAVLAACRDVRIISQGGISMKEAVDLKMIAEVNLMDNKKMYLVKDGQLIEHDLPNYGETVIVTLSGKVDRLETTVKKKV